MNQPDLVDDEHAARILGVTLVVVRRWARLGHLPHYLVGPKQERRFDPGELRAWLADKKAAARKQKEK